MVYRRGVRKNVWTGPGRLIGMNAADGQVRGVNGTEHWFQRPDIKLYRAPDTFDGMLSLERSCRAQRKMTPASRFQKMCRRSGGIKMKERRRTS